METTAMQTNQRGRTVASFVGKVKMAPVPQDPIASTGRRIRNLREKLELSRPQFAKRVGVRATSLKNYELFFRAVDFDAVRNICELFIPSRRDEIIRYLVLGTHTNTDIIPNVTQQDLIDGSIKEREGGIRGVTDDDLMLVKLLRDVRTEGFGLSRPRFCDAFPTDLPPTTLKNYECAYRRMPYDFARYLAEMAHDKVGAWKAITAASRNERYSIAAWVQSA